MISVWSHLSVDSRAHICRPHLAGAELLIGCPDEQPNTVFNALDVDVATVDFWGNPESIFITDMGAEVLDGEVGQKRLAELPAGRFATAAEVAASVVFLLTDAASLFHGQTLCPNGGGHMP